MRTILLLLCLLGLNLLYSTQAVVVNTISQTLSLLDIEHHIADNSFAMLGNSPSSSPSKALVTQDYAYIALTYENRVQKVDLDTGTQASSIFLEDSAGPYDIVASNGFAYVTGNTNSTLYKIDLASDTIVGTLPLGQAPEGMVVCNNELYVANCGFRLSDYSYDPGTVSVIDLATFTAAGTIPVDLNPQFLFVAAGLPHVVCTGDYLTSFGKIDVLDPATHQVSSTVDVGGCPGTALAIDDGTVYIGNGYPLGVYIYDANLGEIIASPETSGLEGGSAFAQNGDLLAIADPGNYISSSIIRFYSLEDMSLSFQIVAGVGAVDIDFVPSGSAADDQAEESPVSVLRVFPNPSRGATNIAFSQPQEEKVSVGIYDLRGRRVRTVTSENAEMCWDGRDEHGAPCASGVYLLRAEYRGKLIGAQKITLIR